MSMMYCPECNREISDMADFCPNCGFPMAKYRNANAEENNIQSQQENSNETYSYPHTEDLKTYNTENSDKKFMYPHTVDLSTYHNLNPFRNSDNKDDENEIHKDNKMMLILILSVAAILIVLLVLLFFLFPN